MPQALPVGFDERPARIADARAILAIGLARDVEDIGRPDWTLDDVDEELRTPGVVPERDGVVVADGAGQIVAFAVVIGTDARVGVHPDACGKGIGRRLAAWAEARAREAGAAELRQVIGGRNGPGRELLEAAGYDLAQRYWQMWRTLDGSESAPGWPGGVTARPFERGRDDRPAYELISDAMRDVPGNTEHSFEQWTVRALGSGFEPELSIAVADGADGLAAAALCQRRENGTGCVDYIAVSRRWRGRGLGRATLAAAMRGFAADGLRHAELWVNGRNESATRLYRSAGMEAIASAGRFVKRL